MFKAYPKEKAVTSYVSDHKGLVLKWDGVGGSDVKGTVDSVIKFAKDPNMKNTGAAMSTVGALVLTVFVGSNPVGLAVGGAMIVIGSLFAAFAEDPEEIARKKFNDDLKQNLTNIQHNQELMIDQLNNLGLGQRAMMELINRNYEAAELTRTLAAYNWAGADGIEGIGSRYSRLLLELKYETDQLETEEDRIKMLYKLGKSSTDIYWDNDLIIKQDPMNMKSLLGKIQGIVKTGANP